MLFILFNIILNFYIYYFLGFFYFLIYHALKYSYFNKREELTNNNIVLKYCYTTIDFIYSFYNIIYYNLLKISCVKIQYKKLVIYDTRLTKKILDTLIVKLNETIKSVINKEQVVKIEVEEDTEDEESEEEYSKIFKNKEEESSFLNNIKKLIE